MAVAGEAEASSTATAGTAGSTAEQLATAAGGSTTTGTATLIAKNPSLQQQLSVDSTSSSTEPADHPSGIYPAPTRQQNDDADDDRGDEEDERMEKKKKTTEDTASSSSSSSPSSSQSPPFVVAVLANSLPPRRARVLIDPSRPPAATSVLAWQRVYGQTLLPKRIDWAYADGKTKGRPPSVFSRFSSFSSPSSFTGGEKSTRVVAVGGGQRAGMISEAKGDEGDGEMLSPTYSLFSSVTRNWTRRSCVSLL
jgi:hypothetical protein